MHLQQWMTWLAILWKNKAISVPTKIKLRKSENKCYRKMLRISSTGHKTNECVLQQELLLSTVNRHRLSLLGHVCRHDTLPKIILQETVDGSRRRGRLRTSWKGNIKEWTGQSMSSLLRITDERSHHSEGMNCPRWYIFSGTSAGSKRISWRQRNNNLFLTINLTCARCNNRLIISRSSKQLAYWSAADSKLQSPHRRDRYKKLDYLEIAAAQVGLEELLPKKQPAENQLFMKSLAITRIQTQTVAGRTLLIMLS